MAPVWLPVGNGSSVDTGLVVSKHHRGSVDGDAQIAEGKTKVDDLLRAGASGDIFTTEGGCLNGRLEL